MSDAQGNAEKVQTDKERDWLWHCDYLRTHHASRLLRWLNEIDSLTAQLAEARAQIEGYWKLMDCGHPWLYRSPKGPCRMCEVTAERDRLRGERDGLSIKLREADALIEKWEEQNDKLRDKLTALQSPSPCGVEGHTMTMWRKMIVTHPLHMSDEALDSGATSEDQGHCQLCAAYAKGREMAAGHVPTVRTDATEAWLVCSCGWQSGPGTSWSERWTNHICALTVTGLADGIQSGKR